MLLPDVLENLEDPEIGGGQPFTVVRKTSTRVLGGVTDSSERFDITGNVQPESLSAQTSTSEDMLTETIVIYAAFAFQPGKNDGGVTITQPDEILYNGLRYRVTRVNNWAEWGFSIAYATKVMDVEEETDEPVTPEESAESVEEVE